MMKTPLEQNQLNSLPDKPENYKWGLFYFNSNDNRVIVPKRIQWMGWTLNFARPASYLIIIAFIAFFIFIGYL